MASRNAGKCRFPLVPDNGFDEEDVIETGHFEEQPVQAVTYENQPIQRGNQSGKKQTTVCGEGSFYI